MSKPAAPQTICLPKADKGGYESSEEPPREPSLSLHAFDTRKGEKLVLDTKHLMLRAPREREHTTCLLSGSSYHRFAVFMPWD